MENKLYMIAGEASGDLHGASLIKALKELRPTLRLTGIGGEKMAAEGFKPLLPFSDFQVMGFSDIVRAYPRLRRHFYTIAKHILEQKPPAVVFIDYPGFNLRLAHYLRKQGYAGKLIQYIAPTVWAWKKGRAKGMAQTLDLLLTIYPFEPAYFPQLRSLYVGHPLLELPIERDNDWRMRYGIPAEMPLIALFPGSRQKEVERNLPLAIAATELFLRKHPEYGCAISCQHPSLEKPILEKLKRKANCWLIPERDRHNLMQEAKVALAKSGTVTLELALLGCPSVVLYKLTWLNYLLVKYLFRIQLPHYALPNILLNERIFPEFYGVKIDPQALAYALEQQLKAPIKEKTQALRTLLTDQKASVIAAQEIDAILT